MHYALCTMHYALYTIHYTLYTIHYTLCHLRVKYFFFFSALNNESKT